MLPRTRSAAVRPLLGIQVGPVAGTLLVVAAGFLSGCQIWPRTETNLSKADWEHSNLYNHRSPYSKLFVEIDAVEGEGPSQAELRELEAFLRRNCDKPGGIRIVVDDQIPRAAVTGRSAESLAVEFLDGARDADSAFLYVLYYNSKLKGNNAVVDNPAFSHEPHPIVWIDRGYRMRGNLYPSTFARAVLLHETGHALGLCATTSHHGKEGHCATAECLMYPSIRFGIARLLTLRNPWANTSLCGDCEAELAANRARSASPRHDFWHGYFRRSEDGYQVLGLPGLTYVNFGPALAAPTDDMLEMRRRAIVDMARGEYVHWATIGSFDPWEHLPALRRVAREKAGPLPRLMEDVFGDVFGKLEELADNRPEEALEWLTDEFLDVAKEFPGQWSKFASLREELSAPPGYGAQLTRQPRNLGQANGDGVDAADRGGCSDR